MAKKKRNGLGDNPLTARPVDVLDAITDTGTDGPSRSRPGSRRTGNGATVGESRVFSVRIAANVADRVTRAARWTTPRTTVRAIVERAIVAELDRMERAYERKAGRPWPED